MLKMLAILLACLTPLAWATEPFRASYALTMDMGMTIRGEAVQSLTRDGDAWIMTRDAQASLGSISERSQFTLTEDGDILPLEFHRETRFLGRSKAQVFRFNWNLKTLDMDGEKLALEPNTYDPLTLSLGLGQALQSNREPTVKMADRGRVRTYTFDNLGATQINGIDTVHLSYERSADRRTEVWLDPARNYLLVKLRSLNDGKVFDIQLTEDLTGQDDRLANAP